jgi:putative hydrolase of the HAD superfamily
MLSVISWIFFDLGSTLIDETEADRHRVKEMTAGTGITQEAYCEKRLEMIRQGLNGDAEAARFFGLKKTPWRSEDETPYPDAVPVLEALKRRGFRLGVIANQNPGTAQRLKNWEMLGYFGVIAASAELGWAKPDTAIFIWALGQAGCPAGKAVMVGDRTDNDIAPANCLGMHTVRLLRGLGAYREPQCEKERPEYTIRTLAELPDLLCGEGSVIDPIR